MNILLFIIVKNTKKNMDEFKILHGLDENLPDNRDENILYHTTDTKDLYIGNTKYLKENDLSSFLTTLKSQLGLVVEGNILRLMYGEEVLDSVILPGGGGGIDCTSIEFETTNIEIEKDGTVQLSPTIKPINCTYDVMYSSNDPSLVTVSSEGLLTWQNGGETTVEVICGSKSVTLNIKLDKLLESIYTVRDISQSASYLMADEDELDINYTQVSGETWSVRGYIEDTDEVTETITVGKNISNSKKTVEGSFEWEGNVIEYDAIQSPYTLLPFKYEIAATDTTVGFNYKTSGYNDRRTIGQLLDVTSQTHMKTDISVPYDGIYIPAQATNVKITWESDNNQWYYSPNIFTMAEDGSITRIHNDNWDHNTGEFNFDTSTYESLWVYGNIAWTKNRGEEPEQHCEALTWEQFNFDVEFTLKDTWVDFKTVKFSNKVNSETGELDENGVSRGLQGGEAIGNSYYQFYDKNGGYNVYDLTDSSVAPVWHKLNCDPQLHFGSVCFSNVYTYDSTTVTTPLICATGHYEVNGAKKIVVDVIDIENDVLVKQYIFPDRKDDAIAAWDFENGKMWLIGYERGTGYAVTKWYIDEYSLENFANPLNTNTTLLKSCYIDGTENNTLQDCKFKDGYIYIATGWGSTKGQTVSVWKYNTETRKIVSKTVSDLTTNQEAEGLALTTDYMVVTTNQKIEKVEYCFDIVNNTKTTDIEIGPTREITADDLYLLGCTEVYNVLAIYPNALDSANAKKGLFFKRNSNNVGTAFKTGIIPNYNETIEVIFETKESIDTSAKTLFCSRANGSGSLSFTTFIISSNIRADYDNPETVNDTNRYSLTPSSYYKYVRKNCCGDSLNNSDLKAFKSHTGTPYETTIPFVLGASITSLVDYNGDSQGRPNTSNYLNNMVLNVFATKNDSGQYTHYLIGVEDNKIIDLVTGNEINACTATRDGKEMNIASYVDTNIEKTI